MRLVISSVAAAALACAQPAPTREAGVDIAWKVLPRRVVADNFGSRVAKLYFAVVAIVGNNSGHDLQVSSILFQMPASTGLGAPVPSDPYNIVRGTLEREHQFGFRNTSINIVKALGPLLTGASGFYAGAVLPQAIDLFSNPFEKGFELVFPDKTLPQLAALDSNTMRGVTIISDNTQQPLLVFVSRDILSTGARQKQLRSTFKNDFEPQAVMRALGDMVLVGKSISYGDRIAVTSKAR